MAQPHHFICPVQINVVFKTSKLAPLIDFVLLICVASTLYLALKKPLVKFVSYVKVVISSLAFVELASGKNFQLYSS